MKINLNKGQEVFLTSDTHFGHHNLCKGISNWGDSRPGDMRDFETLEQMNDTIVNNINDMVGADDNIIHFGDWSFGGIENIAEFRSRINCRNIYLIFGNHDEKIIDNKVIPNAYQQHRDTGLTTQDLFTWCGHYQEFEIIYPQINKATKALRYKFVASHYPFASWNGMGKGMVHFHGHLHLPIDKRVHKNRSMDVGMDGNKYKPLPIHYAFAMVKDNPIQPTNLNQDHHV